ncbi:MAG: hypothetical protein U0R65_05465 [Candidatus Nanopelagicales bacterium]
MLVDQALNSASSFLFLSLVARSATDSEFGVVTIVYSIEVVAMASFRASMGERELLRSGSSARRAKRFWLTLVSLTFVFAATAAAAAPPGSQLVAGLTATGFAAWVLQDFQRYAAISVGAVKAALVSDFVWTVPLAALFLASLGGAATPAGLAAGTWLAGGLVAALTGMWLRPRRVPPERSSDEPPWAGFALVALVNMVGSQAVLIVAAAVGSVAVAGTLRGALLLFAPMNVVFAANRNHWLAYSGVRSAQVQLRAIGGLLVVAVVYVLAVWASGPWLSTIVLGPDIGSASIPLLLPAGLQVLAIAAYAWPSIEVRRLSRFTAAICVVSCGALLYSCLSAWGLVAGGAVGAAWGLAAAEVVVALLYWVALRISVLGAPLIRRASSSGPVARPQEGGE